MPPILILAGFEPFGGERINPSWEIARRLDGEVIGGLQIKSVRVPVGCAKAARHRSLPSMALATMEHAVRIAIAETARSAR